LSMRMLQKSLEGSGFSNGKSSTRVMTFSN